jgi:homoserine dehydrogenase
MGGIEPARTYILKALEAGKHVVTANKALLSHRGREIFEKAHRHRRNVGFEASVCGEIPIVDDFLKFPGLGDIDGLEGIVNGTSNYVLTRFMEGMPIGEALRIAQEKGFAEADPYMDVSGIDAAQKLCILASILFNQPVDFEMIPRQGIDGLTPADADAFRRWGFTVKPIVAARVKQDRLVLYSCPALLPQGHPLASVREENNALSLYLKGRVEPITKIGKGAGAIPTARSIVRDILDVARKARAYMVEVPGYFRAKGGMEMSRVEEIESAWYVRLTVKDNPGVFGKIASILGDFDLSILRVHQEINRDADEAHVLLELKDSPRKRLDMALDLITRFPFVKSCLPCMILQC